MSDRIVATAERGGGPEVYESIVEIQAVAEEELAWLESISPEDDRTTVRLSDYESQSRSLRAMSTRSSANGSDRRLLATTMDRLAN